MEYTQFGQTALRVSKISYGTWQFGGDLGRVEQAQWEAPTAHGMRNEVSPKEKSP